MQHDAPVILIFSGQSWATSDCGRDCANDCACADFSERAEGPAVGTDPLAAPLVQSQHLTVLPVDEEFSLVYHQVRDTGTVLLNHAAQEVLRFF